jgi:hypothetical protein
MTPARAIVARRAPKAADAPVPRTIETMLPKPAHDRSADRGEISAQEIVFGRVCSRWMFGFALPADPGVDQSELAHGRRATERRWHRFSQGFPALPPRDLRTRLCDPWGECRTNVRVSERPAAIRTPLP